MRKWIVLAIASAFALTGCIYTGNRISDQEVAQWQSVADQALPGASKVAVTVDEVYCYTKCGEDLRIDVKFDTYQDLLQHEDGLMALNKLVDSDGSEYRIDLRFDVNDLNTVEEETNRALVADVGGGLEAAEVALANFQLGESGIYNPAYLRLYVEDSAAATPELLGETMDAAVEILGPLAATGESLRLFTMDGIGLSSGAPGYSEAMIDPRELDSFTSVTSGDCVVAGQWAFDISSARIAPYPAHSPGGACA